MIKITEIQNVNSVLPVVYSFLSSYIEMNLKSNTSELCYDITKNIVLYKVKTWHTSDLECIAFK